jgi:peptidase E
MKTRVIALFSLNKLLACRSYTVPPLKRFSIGYLTSSSLSFAAKPQQTESSTTEKPKRPLILMNCGLLLSSFADGLRPNPQARDFLRNGLIRNLLVEEQLAAESSLKHSAIQSPCCGPDLQAVDHLADTDNALDQIDTHPDPIQLLEGQPRVLRFVYIPTAMYALRIDSENKPGKQRQRARTDGKKRRDDVMALLQDFMGPTVTVHAITLDLDDGSVKQPQGSDETSAFPESGKDALQKWNPHLVYVQGGNTFWLYHCVEKGDWKQDLQDLCQGPRQAVYCGASAGAILTGQSIQTACWKEWDDPRIVPDMETYEAWKDVEGLGLIGDASIFPHMDDEWEDMVNEKEKEIDSEVYCLTDADVFLVDGSTQTISIVSNDEDAQSTTSATGAD